MSEKLRVGIIWGSAKSDTETMQHAGRALRTLGLEFKRDYEEREISAHRTTQKMIEYAHQAEERGLQVIIAGAGGSAHLPGMVASETTIPVLGVAITDSPDTLNRALGSMIGMPEGRPLATFQGKAGAFNAGLYAVRILALNDPTLREAYRAYQEDQEIESTMRDEKLSEIGSEAYLLEPKQ